MLFQKSGCWALNSTQKQIASNEFESWVSENWRFVYIFLESEIRKENHDF